MMKSGGSIKTLVWNEREGSKKNEHVSTSNGCFGQDVSTGEAFPCQQGHTIEGWWKVVFYFPKIQCSFLLFSFYVHAHTDSSAADLSRKYRRRKTGNVSKPVMSLTRNRVMFLASQLHSLRYSTCSSSERPVALKPILSSKGRFSVSLCKF